jgi:hypothetical protein
MKRKTPKGLFIVLGIASLLTLSSCEKLLGWGVLLWSLDNPEIPSGTVLPVQIRSNIDQVYVVGIPEEYRSESSMLNCEVPIAWLQLYSSRREAERQAEVFSQYALIYGESLQDGLPIRETAENNARRVYRLKLGEIIKIVSLVEGTRPLNSRGEALDGDWYQVLTEDGVGGYCYSYRLHLFEHEGGELITVRPDTETAVIQDKELERVLETTWYPETYATMISTGLYDMELLNQKWEFIPELEPGLASLHAANVQKTFSYSAILADGTNAWRFDGTALKMNLRSLNALAVNYPDDMGMQRGLIFVTLSADLDSVIAQENTRRDNLFWRIYNQGPRYASTNYGSLSFSQDKHFNWGAYSMLVPHIIPSNVLGSGTIEMNMYLDASIAGDFSGAFTLHFDGVGSRGANVVFLYTLDGQGLRLEYVPGENIEELVVVRRSVSPTVIYFYR